eukprot:g1075.t1
MARLVECDETLPGVARAVFPIQIEIVCDTLLVASFPPTISSSPSQAFVAMRQRTFSSSPRCGQHALTLDFNRDNHNGRGGRLCVCDVSSTLEQRGTGLWTAAKIVTAALCLVKGATGSMCSRLVSEATLADAMKSVRRFVSNTSVLARMKSGISRQIKIYDRIKGHDRFDHVDVLWGSELSWVPRTVRTKLEMTIRLANNYDDCSTRRVCSAIAHDGSLFEDDGNEERAFWMRSKNSSESLKRIRWTPPRPDETLALSAYRACSAFADDARTTCMRFLKHETSILMTKDDRDGQRTIRFPFLHAHSQSPHYRCTNRSSDEYWSTRIARSHVDTKNVHDDVRGIDANDDAAADDDDDAQNVSTSSSEKAFDSRKRPSMPTTRRRRMWTVRVMMDTMTDIFQSSREKLLPIGRILPCGRHATSTVFTVTNPPTGDDDDDEISRPSEFVYDWDERESVNPGICMNASVSSIVRTCQALDGTTHAVRFVTGWPTGDEEDKQPDDGEIYVSRMRPVRSRFPGLVPEWLLKSPEGVTTTTTRRPLRVHFQWESSANDIKSRDAEWLSHMDMMWTYRRRDDPSFVFAPYRHFDPYLRVLFAPEMPRAKTRSRVAIWIQRHCDAQNGREVYVEELMRYMSVDSFGKCLHNTDDRVIPREPRDELFRVASEYKFYIAIENSNCEDYVTEKLNNAIESGAVPVVFAPNNVPDYRKLMPPRSYVNVADFTSAREAAEYLTYLSENDEAYESYLWYKYADDRVKRELKDEIRANWPTSGTSDERVCQLVDGLVRHHGDGVRGIDVGEVTSGHELPTLPLLVDDESDERTAGLFGAQQRGERFQDRSCLRKGAIIEYVV